MRQLCLAVNDALMQAGLSAIPMKLVNEAIALDRRIDRGRKAMRVRGIAAVPKARSNHMERGRSSVSKSFVLAEYEAELLESFQAFAVWRLGLLEQLKLRLEERAIASPEEVKVQCVWLSLLALIAANELTETRGSESECTSLKAYAELDSTQLRSHALVSATRTANFALADMSALRDQTQNAVECRSLDLFVSLNGLANRVESVHPQLRWTDEHLKKAIIEADVFRRWDEAPLTIRTPRNLANLLEFAEWSCPRIPGHGLCAM